MNTRLSLLDGAQDYDSKDITRSFGSGRSSRLQQILKTTAMLLLLSLTSRALQAAPPPGHFNANVESLVSSVITPPDGGAQVETVSLPKATIDTSVINFSLPVLTSVINPGDGVIGFQGDFTFDSTVITFQSPPVSNAGLTSGNWTVAGNVLPGSGTIRTLRFLGYTNDNTPITGSGPLFNLSVVRLSTVPGAVSSLVWRPNWDGFFFIDSNLDPIWPASTPPGRIIIDQTISISGTTSYCPDPDPNPVPAVTFTLTGSGSATAITDGLGHYQFSSLQSGGSYTVTPAKPGLKPSASGITMADAMAVERHWLQIGPPLSGCQLAAADVNGDTMVDGLDVNAIMQFYLGFSNGIANTGQYQFTPANRTYTGIVVAESGQDYETLLFGDVSSPFAEPSPFDPNTNGPIFAVAVQADGKILVGGAFSTLAPNGGATVERAGIARLNQNGTVDMTFDPAEDALVESIVVQPDGKILVGGFFSTFGGSPRNNIARLDPATGVSDSFSPNADNDVSAIALQADGKILIGGGFTSVHGQPRGGVARLDPGTGSPDSFNPNANSGVTSIAVQPDGKILLGGYFTSVGGQSRSHIARVEGSSGLPDSFNPNANDIINTIAVQTDGKILVGGLFDKIGGQTRSAIARLDSITGVADPFDASVAGGAPNWIYSILIQADNKILVGGAFTEIGGATRHHLARLDPVTALADSFNPNANGDILSIAQQADGRILAGGFFTSMNGATRRHVARLESTGGEVNSPHRTGANDVQTAVATVSLPDVAIDTPGDDGAATVTTSVIDGRSKLVGFQGDFTFDERVVAFPSGAVEKAGLTNGNWSVSGNVLDGPGPIRTLRIAGYSNDFRPLSGAGILFKLRPRLVSPPMQRSPLMWATAPSHFIFIDADLRAQPPVNAISGSVTSALKPK